MGFPLSKVTTRHIRNLLPNYLEKIGKIYRDRPDLILAAWPDVVGPQLAPMTEAVAFVDGILTVRVKSSTLYMLLSQIDKPKIIKNVRDKFPGTLIKTVNFHLG